jgi:low affinity Fe/Cu permease
MKIRFKSLWQWYINTIIGILDIINLSFIQKQGFGDWTQSVSGDRD